MAGIYEKVIKNTKKIESLIEEKLSAEGKGLYEKTISVEEYLDQEVVRKIRRIATIRNKLMHEDEFEIADTVSFEEDCKEVIYYLSTTEFNSTSTLSQKKTKQSSNTRACKSCGADTKPVLRIIHGGWFTRERMRHICAICGEDMYITGGGSTGIFWYFVLGFISVFIMGFINSVGSVSLVFNSVQFIIVLAAFYWWRKRKKK